MSYHESWCNLAPSCLKHLCRPGHRRQVASYRAAHHASESADYSAFDNVCIVTWPLTSNMYFFQQTSHWKKLIQLRDSQKWWQLHLWSNCNKVDWFLLPVICLLASYPCKTAWRQLQIMSLSLLDRIEFLIFLTLLFLMRFYLFFIFVCSFVFFDFVLLLCINNIHSYFFFSWVN